MAQIIDGKAIAARERDRIRVEVEAFVAAHGRAPGLEVLLVGDDPASHVYVRNKESAATSVGIRGAVHRLPASTSQAELLERIDALNADPATDGILVQLPLPTGLDTQVVLDRVHPSKDVDGLHPINAGLLAVGRPGLRPCTPLGCMRLLEVVEAPLAGARAVVVGRSNLVGKPIAMMLLERHATVTVAHSRTRDLGDVVREADIVVAAVGKAGLVRGEWIRHGAVVLDVGTTRGADGKLKGDVEFGEAAKRASFITPVPGGVGPMTIAMLLANTVQSARARVAT